MNDVNQKLFCGVDSGTSATKVVVMNENGDIVGHHTERTGAFAPEVALNNLKIILDSIGCDMDQVIRTGSTGYAREDIAFSDFTKTEITCHSQGCLKYFDGPFTIVDIGGQDNKIIRLDENGKRTGFKMNRKCAAGTGMFIEEIANLMNVPLGDLNKYAESSLETAKLGSYCTVFTKTEILTNFRKGDKLPEIVAGVYESIVKRILEMDALSGRIVLSGGVVEHNPYIKSVFERLLECEVLIPPHPQLMGAIGIAIFAADRQRIAS
ncbi:MAG TPA: acyl-CoA dehydratase activase [bacterium]|jgi:predicted CoA-substrate-specific enzyme activase